MRCGAESRKRSSGFVGGFHNKLRISFIILQFFFGNIKNGVIFAVQTTTQAKQTNEQNEKLSTQKNTTLCTTRNSRARAATR